jgi:hypothetical protein
VLEQAAGSPPIQQSPSVRVPDPREPARQSVAAREIIVLGGEFGALGKLPTSPTPVPAEVRYRHWNHAQRLRVHLGYYGGTLSGSIPETISSTARPGAAEELDGTAPRSQKGFLVIEYGSLEMYNFDVNFMYRFSQRSRFSPFASAGAGLYVWRVPVRLQFFNVPSFGEQHAYDPIGNSGSQFVFDDRYPPQVIDYTKHETSGGLNAAFGLDLRLTAFGLRRGPGPSVLLRQGTVKIQRRSARTPGFLRCQGSLYYRF